MGIVRRKDFEIKIDQPRRSVDVQQRLLDEALKERNNVKKTTLSRLHGIKTEVIYYEQVVSNRQGNLANNSAANQFDPNTQRYRKITNFVILTDEMDSQLDKDVFTNLSYEGTAKILPNTLIPNINDYFIMKVFDSYHVFRITEVNPTLIEKDSGYEILYSMYRQDIIPENFEINENVKEVYTFDYNHTGTEFRTILRIDEYEFLEKAREIMYSMVKVYTGVFYHRTLNTVMCESGNMKIHIHDLIRDHVTESPTRIIGTVLTEGRSVYDINLTSFINRYNLLSADDYIEMITEHIKPNRKSYRASIFGAIEHMDMSRLKNTNHFLVYSNSNLYNHTNRLYGRFLIDHVEPCEGMEYVFDGWFKSRDLDIEWDFENEKMPPRDITLYAKWIEEKINLCEVIVNLYPDNFLQRINDYDSDIMYNSTPEYSNVNDLFIDIIGCFISEKDMARKRSIIVKLVNILMSSHINYIHESEFEDSFEIFYTYPLAIYVLKYMTREISHREYK